MARQLRYAGAAIDNLRAIRRWQTQPGSGRAASARVRTLRAAIRRLKADPCLHPFGDVPGVREMTCEGHRVLYAVSPDTGRSTTAGNVMVLRVFGPGQSRE